MSTSTYLESIFTSFIDSSNVKIIFELGSRDLVDSRKLQEHYNAEIYAFECNPDCLNICNKKINKFKESVKSKLHLIPKAVSETNDIVSFYPFDLQKYNNMGASSMFKIDFTKRQKSCPDYGRPCPQNEIKVPGIRLDTFLESNNIPNIDLLCMDLQGYELNALKSLGAHLKNIKYIITECQLNSTYDGGVNFKDLDNYLNEYGFQYKSSTRYQYKYPNLNETGLIEFDSLYINSNF
jgi:FkbM family methyltransferase